MGREPKKKTVNLTITITGDERLVVKTATAITAAVAALAPKDKLEQLPAEMSAALKSSLRHRRAKRGAK